MTTEYKEGVPSRLAVFGHPIHPILVPFPIGFLIGAAMSDLAYVYTRDAFWARASLWLVAAGVVGGLSAAVFGLIDFLTVRRARAHVWGWVHLIGNLAAVLLSAASLALRLGNIEGAVLPVGLGLSLVVALLLLLTGWAGGELAYRYKVGVAGDGRAEDERQHAQTAARPPR